MKSIGKCYKPVLLGMFALMLICGTTWAADKQISIGTASATGTYYPIGAAYAKVINDSVKGVYAVAEVTGGSVENMKLVSTGNADIGLANQMHFPIAVKGGAPFNKPITNLRALFPLSGKKYVMKHAYQVVVLQDSDIHSLLDLKGKKVGVGPAGSGTEVYTKRIFQSLGMTYKDITPRFSSYTESVMAMQDGNLDAMILHSAVPTGAVVELGSTRKIRLVNLKEETIEKVMKDWGFNRKTIPAGSYEWQKEDATTVVSAHHAIFVNKDMDPELAYKLTKAAMEHKERIWASNPAARNFDEYGVELGHLVLPPLHPGAIKFFKEFGVKIPDSVIPPEAK